MFRFFSFLGDRARYPLKLRPEGLVNRFYRCRGIKDGENAFDQHECVFQLYVTSLTPFGKTLDVFRSKC